MFFYGLNSVVFVKDRLWPQKAKQICDLKVVFLAERLNEY